MVFLKGLRYSTVGVMMAGMFSTLAGCTVDDALRAFILALLLSLSGGGEETTSTTNFTLTVQLTGSFNNTGLVVGSLDTIDDIIKIILKDSSGNARPIAVERKYGVVPLGNDFVIVCFSEGLDIGPIPIDESTELDPAGDLDPICQATLPEGTIVTLFAVFNQGGFLGADELSWDGCDETTIVSLTMEPFESMTSYATPQPQGTPMTEFCQVTMNQDRTVSADFEFNQSDKNVKENFTVLDRQAVLHRLNDIPISKWNYQWDDASIRHIGPMAQDFYSAFEVGNDDRHINSIDGIGVALISIQGLYELNLEKELKLQEQAQEIAALKAQMQAVMERLAEMEAQLTPRE